MLDALPPLVVDRVCLHLRSVRDASALQQTSKRLRRAGLSPECKWHWRLTLAQSTAMWNAPVRTDILVPGTAIHTLYLPDIDTRDMAHLVHVHTVRVRDNASLNDKLDELVALPNNFEIIMLPDTTRTGILASVCSRAHGRAAVANDDNIDPRDIISKYLLREMLEIQKL